jgi:hypothetical protein
MKALLSLSSIGAAMLFLAATAVRSDDAKAKHEAMSADKPGPIHKEMARRAGEYETVAKFWMKPGTDPVESKGSAKITSVIDGHFLLEESTGTQFGQPIKGLRLTGYNNLTKQYEATWTYTMATGMMHMTGASKDDGKTIEWIASFMDDKAAKQTLYVTTRNIDDDHFVVELVAKTPEGTKGPTLETTYIRKK